MTEIWVADAPNGMLSPSDRALAYGDGLFATMLSSGGAINFLISICAVFMTALPVWALAGRLGKPCAAI